MKEFFSENGKLSLMRLMSFISLIASVIMGFILISKDFELSNIEFYIFLGFLFGAFAPKTIQKFAEKKLDIKVDELEHKKDGN